MSTQIAFAQRDRDGMAVIGRTFHDLRGIRFDNGEGGNAPAGEGGAGGESAPVTETEAQQILDAMGAGSESGWDGKIESLDPRVQKIITDLRRESADHRVKRNETDSKLQAILKAAGVGETEDPAQVLEQTTTKLTAAEQRAQDAERKLAVFTASSGIADPTKLLDRSSFMNSIRDLDVTDGTALKTAIEAAVRADPTLKAARAASTSTVDTSGGTGEQGQITEEQLQRMSPEQIDKALREGKLKHLLG